MASIEELFAFLLTLNEIKILPMINAVTIFNKPLSQAMSLHWSSSFSFIDMSLIPHLNKIVTVREFALLDNELNF